MNAEATVTREYGYIFVRLVIDGRTYLGKFHPQRPDSSGAWSFDDAAAAEEWLQFQLGWLYFWSTTAEPPPDDASESFRAGWDAAGADANERAMWLDEQRQVERDQEEQQRFGWMT